MSKTLRSLYKYFLRNMAELSELQMNVAALKRVDPYVKEILGTATHVALYTFNGDANEWERTDVEGALFVYSRNGEPYHGILIMNRLNTKNLVEPVIQGLELQLQEPFLLYRNTNCRIFGIWFYDKEQCTRIASMLDKLVNDLDTLKNIPGETAVRNKTTGSCTAGVDIFSMLNKAQEDYNSNKIPEQNKSSVATATEASKLTMQDNVPPKSVIDFFAKASVPQFAVHKSPHSSGLLMTRPQHTGLVRDVADDNHLKPILQRLMSNPAHSVEHIEKQQRSATPHNDKSNNEEKHIKKETKVLNGNVLRGHTIPNCLSEKPGGLASIEVENPKAFPESNASTETVENSMKFLRIASPNPTGPGLAPVLFGPVVQPMTNNGISINPVSDQRSSSAPAYNNETPSKLALMPPTMFTSSVSKESTNPEVSNGSSAVSESQTSFVSSNTTTMDDTVIQIKPEPLTKKQLLQAFNYLMKNDTDFMTKLHEAYVKSFSDIVNS